MGSRLTLDPALSERIMLWRQGMDAEAAFLVNTMIVVDGMDWGVDLDLIRTGLSPVARAYKDGFRNGPIPARVVKELDRLRDRHDVIFGDMFPTFNQTGRRSSFRPMVTGPEPMHFDAYAGDTAPMVTSFVNVALTPRRYRLSYSFPELVDMYPDLVREISDGIPDLSSGKLSYRLRAKAADGEPPLGNAPFHEIELASGAVWFFNAKMVSHQVVYGEGADSTSWTVPDCGAQTQAEIIEMTGWRSPHLRSA